MENSIEEVKNRLLNIRQQKISEENVYQFLLYFDKLYDKFTLDNFHVQVFFDDGKIVDYDATEDLKAEIFKPLRDIDAFKEACTVMNGTLAWDLSGNRDESSCIDIDPFTVYELESINNLIA